MIVGAFLGNKGGMDRLASEKLIMNVRRSQAETLVQAPAKLNLFFEVKAKRDDGYHEIESLMLPVALFDTIRFRPETNPRIVFSCGLSLGFSSQWSGDLGDIPRDERNLVVRAVELLRRRAEVRDGARIDLVKRIPTAAGMGGGSSDAAAALLAANVGWGLHWSVEALAQLAAEIGSDVPFFLVGGPAVCRGRGEIIESTSGIGSLHFVVVRPPVGLSTATVYGKCRPAAHPESVLPLIDALRKGDKAEAGRLLFNRLQPVAQELCPWIDRLQAVFSRSDCLGHGMSGSGTAYFGLCRHAAHARHVARRLDALSLGRVFAVRGCI